VRSILSFFLSLPWITSDINSIFAFLHIKCFTYKVYIPDPTTIEGDLEDYRTPRLKSLGHAMNPMETFRELRAGVVYMMQRWRGKETDRQARRLAAHEGVFGHSRSRVLSDGTARSEFPIRADREKMRKNNGPSPLSRVDSGRLEEALVNVEREIYLESERQWLGVGDRHDYLLGGVTREKSEGFEDQVIRELYRRGYTIRGKIIPGHVTVNTSLTLRDRIEQAQQGQVDLQRCGR
jgi:hypothetical protein